MWLGWFSFLPQGYHRAGSSYNVRDSDSTASDEEQILHHEKSEEGAGPVSKEGQGGGDHHGGDAVSHYHLHVCLDYSLRPSLPPSPLSLLPLSSPFLPSPLLFSVPPSSLTLEMLLCTRLSTRLSIALGPSPTLPPTCDCGHSAWLMLVSTMHMLATSCDYHVTMLATPCDYHLMRLATPCDYHSNII